MNSLQFVFCVSCFIFIVSYRRYTQQSISKTLAFYNGGSVHEVETMDDLMIFPSYYVRSRYTFRVGFSTYRGERRINDLTWRNYFDAERYINDMIGESVIVYYNESDPDQHSFLSRLAVEPLSFLGMFFSSLTGFFSLICLLVL